MPELASILRQVMPGLACILNPDKLRQRHAPFGICLGTSIPLRAYSIYHDGLTCQLTCQEIPPRDLRVLQLAREPVQRKQAE